MPVWDNINRTTSSGVAPSVKEYYDATLQKTLQPNLVHARDAQKVPLPEHNGKYVRFRRPVRLNAITTPLSEGVTPDGQQVEMTDFRVMVKPYGGYIPLTDEANFYMLDNMTRMSALLLAEQARVSLDTILRDAYCAGSNVFFAGAATSRAGLTASDLLDGPILKKVARMLERASVPKFADGFFHAIIDPETKFDLTADPLWTDVAKYQNTENMERYEVGRMLGFKFFETPNAKVFEAAAHLFGTCASLDIDAQDPAARRLTLTADAALITPDVARQLAGMLVDVQETGEGGVRQTVCIERAEREGGAARIYLRWWPAVTPAAGAVIVPTGGASAGVKAHCTLAYGADAFGTVSLGGGEAVETILNPPGSSGGLDPLNQRATVGWKAKGFCGVILDDERVCRIEHAVTE